ncbi:MAG: hypothetical protein AAFA34_02220 [Thermoplasmata archaeon]|jgi:hypothetical protein
MTRGGDRSPIRPSAESTSDPTSRNRGSLVVRSQGVEILSVDLDRHWARVDLGLGGPPGDPGLPLPSVPVRRVLALASLLARRGWTVQLDRHARSLFTLGQAAPAWAGHLGPHLRGVAEWIQPGPRKAPHP